MNGQTPMSAAEFAAVLDVSRETLERLQAYEALLRQWQKTVNLVSAKSLDDVWRRHFLDSGQLCRLLADAKSVADIGSGAGFPGLVVAIMAGAQVTLVEADNRKAAFLREASRLTAADTKIIAGRAENEPPTPVEAIIARAVAPLEKLLSLAEPWLQPGGRCYFLKGATIENELTDARRVWDINYDVVPSLSDPAGTILCVKEFHRA